MLKHDFVFAAAPRLDLIPYFPSKEHFPKTQLPKSAAIQGGEVGRVPMFSTFRKLLKNGLGPPYYGVSAYPDT